MEEIAKLHIQALRSTASSMIGIDYLVWLYLQVKEFAELKIEKKDGEIVAVMTITKNLGVTQREIEQMIGWRQWGWVIRSVIKNPKVLVKLWERKVFIDQAIKKWGGRAWIMTFIVSPKWQRKGIGSLMVRRVPRGILVDTDAQTAVFYHKNGFVQVGRIGKAIIMEKK